MQPDLPEPGGAGDEQVRHPREVGPDGVAGDVLADPDGERRRGSRQVVEDVTERDELGREVRHLHADGLLARDRREDADLGRGERVREIVLERRHLRDLRARRELELVADDAGPGDLTHDRGVDAEVRERLHEQVCGARARLARPLGRGRRRLEQRAIRQPVVGAAQCRREDGRLLVRDRVRLRSGLREERGRGRRRADDVRIGLHPVDGMASAIRRRRGNVREREPHALRVAPLEALERPLGSRAGAPHGMTRAAEHRAGRRAADEQRAREEESDPDDHGARLPDDLGQTAAERLAHDAAVIATERDHQPDGADREPRAERAQVDECAPHEHQAAEHDEDERDGVRGRPQHVARAVGHPGSGRAAVPAEPEHRREEGADRGHPEPPELGMVVRSGLAPLLLPDPCGGAWLELSLSLPLSHGTCRFLAPRRRSCGGAP